MKRVFGLAAFLATLAVIAACQPLPIASPQPTSVLPLSTPSASVAATPTNAAVPAAEEEDCMAACHVPEPDIATGAKPQPPNHAGRITCLECHATLDKPVLPATHVGRLDPSCIVCHAANPPAQ